MKAKTALNRILCSAGILSLAVTGIFAAAAFAEEPQDPVEEQYDVVIQEDAAYVDDMAVYSEADTAEPVVYPSFVALVDKEGRQAPDLTIDNTDQLKDFIYYYNFTVGSWYEIKAKIVNKYDRTKYIDNAGSVWVQPEYKDGWAEIVLEKEALEKLESGTYIIELTVTESTYTEWIDYQYVVEDYQTFTLDLPEEESDDVLLPAEVSQEQSSEAEDGIQEETESVPEETSEFQEETESVPEEEAQSQEETESVQEETESVQEETESSGEETSEEVTDEEYYGENQFYRVAGGPGAAGGSILTAGTVYVGGQSGPAGSGDDDSGNFREIGGVLVSSDSAPTAADFGTQAEEPTTTTSSSSDKSPKSSNTNGTSSSSGITTPFGTITPSGTIVPSGTTSSVNTTGPSSASDTADTSGQVNKTKSLAATVQTSVENGNPPQTDDSNPGMSLAVVVAALSAMAAAGILFMLRRKSY